LLPATAYHILTYIARVSIISFKRGNVFFVGEQDGSFQRTHGRRHLMSDTYTLTAIPVSTCTERGVP